MAATPQIDPSIVAMAAARDVAAFEQILSAFEQPIFRYVQRFVRQRQDAEDLTQEIFIKVYRHLSQFDQEKKFSVWLYAIATNTVYDWLRKKKRSQELLILDEEGVETIDTEQTYLSIEVHHDVTQALEKLQPIYKTALLLFYNDGFRYEEIADILHLPLNTVKTYLYRGKQQLKKILEGG